VNDLVSVELDRHLRREEVRETFHERMADEIEAQAEEEAQEIIEDEAELRKWLDNPSLAYGIAAIMRSYDTAEREFANVRNAPALGEVMRGAYQLRKALMALIVDEDFLDRVGNEMMGDE
jgi:hypothetical protein